MTSNQFSIFLFNIIIISNVEATNSCIEEWLKMQAPFAAGKASLIRGRLQMTSPTYWGGPVCQKVTLIELSSIAHISSV